MTVKSIKLYKSEEYKNSKGKIQKYVSIKNSFFSGFGEVYFNSINKNSHKGWNSIKKEYLSYQMYFWKSFISFY